MADPTACKSAPVPGEHPYDQESSNATSLPCLSPCRKLIELTNALESKPWGGGDMHMHGRSAPSCWIRGNLEAPDHVVHYVDFIATVESLRTEE